MALFSGNGYNENNRGEINNLGDVAIENIRTLWLLSLSNNGDK